MKAISNRKLSLILGKPIDNLANPVSNMSSMTVNYKPVQSSTPVVKNGRVNTQESHHLNRLTSVYEIFEEVSNKK